MLLFRYDTATGRIISTVQCSEKQAIYQASDELGVGVIVAPTDATLESSDFYVDLGGEPTARLREPLICSVEADGLNVTVSGVPDGSSLVVEEKEVEADALPTEIEFDAPGTYEIRIYPPPQYLDETLEVTVG